MAPICCCADQELQLTLLNLSVSEIEYVEPEVSPEDQQGDLRTAKCVQQQLHEQRPPGVLKHRLHQKNSEENMQALRKVSRPNSQISQQKSRILSIEADKDNANRPAQNNHASGKQGIYPPTQPTTDKNKNRVSACVARTLTFPIPTVAVSRPESFAKLALLLRDSY